MLHKRRGWKSVRKWAKCLCDVTSAQYTRPRWNSITLSKFSFFLYKQDILTIKCWNSWWWKYVSKHMEGKEYRQVLLTSHSNVQSVFILKFRLNFVLVNLTNLPKWCILSHYSLNIYLDSAEEFAALGVHGMIILKLILLNLGMWTAFNWLRICFNDGHMSV
jgi:hypothetical protein